MTGWWAPEVEKLRDESGVTNSPKQRSSPHLRIVKEHIMEASTFAAVFKQSGGLLLVYRAPSRDWVGPGVLEAQRGWDLPQGSGDLTAGG